MDRIWQWAWDRHGARYSWAIYAVLVPVFLQIYRDAILLTDHCVDALASRPPELIDRGAHALKGKSAAVQVFGLDPGTPSSS
jgi:hypothetical protein